MEPGGLAQGEDGAQAAPLAPGGGSDPLPTLGLGFPICALKDLVSVISDVMGKPHVSREDRIPPGHWGPQRGGDREPAGARGFSLEDLEPPMRAGQEPSQT